MPESQLLLHLRLQCPWIFHPLIILPCLPSPSLRHPQQQTRVVFRLQRGSMKSLTLYFPVPQSWFFPLRHFLRNQLCSTRLQFFGVSGQFLHTVSHSLRSIQNSGASPGSCIQILLAHPEQSSASTAEI